MAPACRQAGSLGRYAAINTKEQRSASCPASCRQCFKTKAWGGRGAGKFYRLDQRKNKNSKGGNLRIHTIQYILN